jgi:hypothetical protein
MVSHYVLYWMAANDKWKEKLPVHLLVRWRYTWPRGHAGPGRPDLGQARAFGEVACYDTEMKRAWLAYQVWGEARPDSL